MRELGFRMEGVIPGQQGLLNGGAWRQGYAGQG